MTLFEHTPAPDRPAPPGATHDHFDVHTRLHRVNMRLALTITTMVGTMWCAYIFMVLALISAPGAFQSGQVLVIVGWLAQTFLQLVLLPVIIVGQNVQAKASDARAQATYDDIGRVHHHVEEIIEHLHAQDKHMLNTNPVPPGSEGDGRLPV